MANLHSVNLGTARPLEYADEKITGIDKRPVGHPVQVAAPGPKGKAGSGLAGDVICSRRHHGGDDQAVYAYALEDLDDWAIELDRPIRPGMFGENLTTSGVDVSGALVGEHWAVGDEVVLEVSDPRVPCRTFSGFLGEPGWIRRFTRRAVPGTYLRVVRPGTIRSGDPIEVIHRPDHQVSVKLAFRALTLAPELLPQLVGITALSTGVQRTVRRRVPVELEPEIEFELDQANSGTTSPPADLTAPRGASADVTAQRSG